MYGVRVGLEMCIGNSGGVIEQAVVSRVQGREGVRNMRVTMVQMLFKVMGWGKMT